VNDQLSNADLRVFIIVARKASFSKAAEELGMSAAYVSKRINLLEQDLGVRLLHRSTRRVAVTEDGERVYAWAQTILDNIDRLYEDVSATRRTPRGQLRLCSSFGFGRNIVAPEVARLIRTYPGLQVRFELFDRMVDIESEGFDLDIRVGDEIASHLVARQLLSNHRVLCAAPDYLARRGAPKSLQELSNHDCLVIKERDHPFGVWRLRNASLEETVKVTGPLSSNNGEIVLQWAVQGMGIVLRSLWDARPWLDRGELVQVLPEYRQDANVWAVYPSSLIGSARIRVCVEFFQHALTAKAGSLPAQTRL
jgi:LysR family transcriptional activator of dmlA